MLDLRKKNLILYIVKCLIGCGIAFLISYFFPKQDISWFLISIFLVLTPDSQEAVPLAVTRIKANIIASFVSLVVLTLGAPLVVSVALAVAMTIFLCAYFNVIVGSRSALAAIIIIMLHPHTASWYVVLERVISVIAGCGVALILTYLFHRPNSPKKSSEVFVAE